MASFAFLARGLCAGASAIIAITSLSAAIASFRAGEPVEPYVWIENPLGRATVCSVLWHLAIATIFGAASRFLIIRPQPSASLRGVRATQAAIVAMLLLALKDAAVFYRLLVVHRIDSHFPVPLSLIVGCLLVLMVFLLRRGRDPVPTSTWRIVPPALTGCLTGSVGLVLLHLLTFGSTDYTRSADVAIILGAKVYSNGTPSVSLADRLRTGIELYRAGRVNYLLMTGGTGVEGYNEALAMREFAVAAGVPEDRILVDMDGVNTLASATNCQAILEERGLSSALIVSHYYHLARCKMLFAERRLHCTTVPARMSMRLVKEPYYVARECAAYLVYALERPLRA